MAVARSVGRPAKLDESDNALIAAMLQDFVPLVSIAARLKVHRHTLVKFIKEHEELQTILEDRNEGMVDLAERALLDASLGKSRFDADGNPEYVNVNAVIFMLERMGRKRGYSQHVEVEATNAPTFTFCRATSTIPAIEDGGGDGRG